MLVQAISSSNGFQQPRRGDVFMCSGFVSGVCTVCTVCTVHEINIPVERCERARATAAHREREENELILQIESMS